MTEDEVIKFCVKHGIKVEQYFFIWLLLRKDWDKPFNQSLTKQYLKVSRFLEEDIMDLERKGIITNLNTPPQTLPEFYLVSDEISKEIIADEDSGEELWKAYPATFPLSGGSSFIARAGGDKDDLIDAYLKKIKRSPVRHKFVMSQLKKYVEMVKQGKVNGYKISDFISLELWETISDIEKQKGGSFGRDI